MRRGPHVQLARSLLSWLILWAGSFVAWRASGVEGRPNLIIILCDDLGYGDLGCYGNPHIKTPHLDQMAKEGMRFTDFHVADSVCSPSRAALLTGRYPLHTGISRVLFPTDKIGLSPDIPTLSSVLKRAGYATFAVGKWHLGHLPPYLPLNHGFDHYFGIPYSNDMGADPSLKTAPGVRLAKPDDIPAGDPRPYPGAPLMRDNEVIEHPVVQSTLTRRYTDEAIHFLESQTSRPFFLYLAHTMPHVPIAASPFFRGHSAAGLYGDVVEELDSSVGEVLSTLRKKGLAENTLVIFTSDNGPWLAMGTNSGSAGPLRGGKFSQFEGGHREPALAWWPGKIPAGKVAEQFTTTLDLLPTFCGMAGLAVPKNVEGHDIRAILDGEPRATTPYSVFYHMSTGVRLGPWKYVSNAQGKFLFDLSKDPGETRNLAETEPSKLAQMQGLLGAWNEKNSGSSENK